MKLIDPNSDPILTPPSLDHLTHESTLRHPCKLKQAAKHLNNPGLISLGGGLPCPEYFPISSLTLHVPTPPDFSEAATLAPGGGETLTIGKYDTTIPPTSASGAPHHPEYDLSIALNYGQGNGSAQMTRFVTEHIELLGAPPYADWGVCLTIGSTGALEQILRMLCDGPGRGDCVLTEEFSFSTALETAVPLQVTTVGVRMDGEGLIPEAMDEILSQWDSAAASGSGNKLAGKRKPHVLYTVPSGQNPTGATQSAARRQAIYEVARRHDVLIIEDEPYYYLQMQAPGTAPPSTVDEFLKGLVPTYLSLDVDGRVIRMDSFSKVVVPGSRMGWITASAQLVERFTRHAEMANQGPNGFSQVILHKLLDERWGHEGYFGWLMNLRMEYTKRRDVMAAACEEFLPKEVVSWAPPQAGMFVSFCFTPFPRYPFPPFYPDTARHPECILTKQPLSNGSKSTTPSTPTHRTKPSSTSRKRSSIAASPAACWWPAAPGSAPSRTWLRLGCICALPLRRPRLRI